MKHMPAGQFKAEWLKLMTGVKKTRLSIIITKRNIPVAKWTPIDEEENSLFGKMKGTAHIKTDIIQSIGKKWNAA